MEAAPYECNRKPFHPRLELASAHNAAGPRSQALTQSPALAAIDPPQAREEQAPGLRSNCPTKSALDELDRLVIEIRTSISESNRFRALSALVAVQPLIGHLLELFSEMPFPVTKAESVERESRAGYL